MAEKSIGKNAVYSFIKAFVSFALPLITFPYASRILLPEGIGKINFSLSIVYYFTSLAQLGIANYGTREAAKLKNDKEKLSKFCKEILTINLISTVISFSAFMIILFSVPKLVDYRSILLVFSTYIIFAPLSMDWLYNALEEFKYVTIRQFIFQIIALVYLFIFVRTKEDTVHYAVFGAISATGSYICNFIHSRRFISLRKTEKLEIKKHLKFVFTFFGMSLVTSIYSYLDSTILGFLSDDKQVGFYSSATKISNMCISLITATALVLLPRLSSYINENKKEEFNSLCKKSLNLIVLLAVPMCFGIISLAEQIILVFSGPNYLPAANCLCMISPVIVMISISFLTGTQIIPSISKEKISLISYIVGALSNCILNFILIPNLGAFGATLATLIAEIIITIIQFIYLRKLLVSKAFFINLLQALISASVMLVIIKIYLHFITSLPLQIIGSVIIGILIYFLVLFLFHNKTLQELKLKVKSKLSKGITDE